MEFFQLGPLPVNQVIGHYDMKLVVLSYLVAVFASYIALSIARSMRSPLIDRMNYWKWLLSGAVVMGLGIWTMHFIGMEAYIMADPMSYSPGLTFLSLLIAIIASGFALFVVARPKVSLPQIIFGGVLMGLAIAAMHYVGMIAMLEVDVKFLPSLFILSIIIAVVASQAALWLMIRSYDIPWLAKLSILSALVMGAAICGMHYVGMFAAVMTSEEGGMNLMMENRAGLPPVYVVITSGFIMLIFMALSSSSQKFLVSLQKSNDELREKEVLLKEACINAEEANIAKRFFLANMSHEIRTPLNVIIGTVSLLARSPMNEKEKIYIQRITGASQLLLSLITDILDFSKIEAGELKLNMASAELIEQVKEVIHIMSTRIDEKKLKLIFESENLQPIYIISDSLRVQQVLTNLISNAIKFTESGSITVRIIPGEEKNDCLPIRFEVQDTGIGISKDKFGELFQKFSQIDNTTTRKFGGTGLGLAISRELVRLLGGTIGCTSEVGVGSTFWFEIPFMLDQGAKEKKAEKIVI